MLKKIVGFFTISLLFFTACVPTHPAYNPAKYTNSYNQSDNKLHPQYKIYHVDEKTTRIYLKFFSQEIKYSKANPENLDLAFLKIAWLISPSITNPVLIDSSSITLKLKKVEGQTSIIAHFEIKDIKYADFVVKINIIDKYSTKKSSEYIRVIRSSKGNEQYWLSAQESNKKPIFKNYFNKKDKFLIQTSDKNADSIFVKHYNTTFGIAFPPFYTLSSDNQSVKFDTIYTVKKEDGNFKFSAQKTGLYFLQTDTSQNTGFAKLYFYDDYPSFTLPEQLIEPMQYLLSTQEYENLKNSENLKLSLDQIWLKFAKNPEKAKQLIKVWYNRAIFANFYFTSYKEGWKTDRGMVYMVFGAPQNVKYADTYEQWIYSEGKNYSPVYFNFVKEKYSISNNDFSLKRNLSYRNFWYKAIDTWRNGEAFSSKK